MQQMGFGFEVTDCKGKSPDFIKDFSLARQALTVIKESTWVCLDVETTGLTEASAPVTLSPKDLKQDARATVRMRTIQARVGVRNSAGKVDREDYVFDCDAFSADQLAQIAHGILSCKMLIAHNAGFDLYWVRRAQGRTQMPTYVIDTMLLTRLLQPELVLARAALLNGHDFGGSAGMSPVQQAAYNSLVGGASGGSLADVVLAMFETVVDKTYQLPQNWAGLLGFAHYKYALDDIIWADKILCNLLCIEEDDDPYAKYLLLREENPLVKLIEPQVPELVMLREAGMPLNQKLGQHYAKLQNKKIAQKAQDLIKLVPALEEFRRDLEDPDTGKSADLQKVLAKAFIMRGVTLRVTAATQTEQIGEKDLRACRAERIESAKPLFDAWVGLCRAKKTRSMALDVVEYAKRSDNGRLRSLMSHGPVTGRLAASEPNCQQWPRDQIFRAMCISGESPNASNLELTVNAKNQPFLEHVAGKPLSLGDREIVGNDWLSVCMLMEKSAQNMDAQERVGIEQHLENAFTHRIVASDFGALDVRVGAALCIRSQREMLLLAQGADVPGGTQPSADITRVVNEIVAATKSASPDLRQASLTQLEKQYATRVRANTALLTELYEKKESQQMGIKAYWTKRQLVKDELLGEKLGYRLAQCLRMGDARGDSEYSALRDAFQADIDVHTFTGMKLVGRDPLKEFEGIDRQARKALEGKLKKELGPRRQQGKIANLSLLYGMGDAGFQEAAARGYDEHWTLEEARAIRDLWLNAYPEVELWHLWTEALSAGVVYMPTKGRPKPSRTQWWRARTLAGRTIVAFGLNAALSYQDQSSGADILGMIMHTLHTQYPHIFKYSINQIHDEQVFSWPKENHEEYLPIVEQVMVDEANKLTMPYGVPCAVSPACGVFWIKD